MSQKASAVSKRKEPEQENVTPGMSEGEWPFVRKCRKVNRKYNEELLSKYKQHINTLSAAYFIDTAADKFACKASDYIDHWLKPKGFHHKCFISTDELGMPNHLL